MSMVHNLVPESKTRVSVDWNKWFDFKRVHLLKDDKGDY